MASLPRRRVLRGVVAASLAVGGGCATRRNRRSTAAETDPFTATETASQTTTAAESSRTETETRTAAERIMLAFSNASAGEAVVRFAVSSDGTTIAEGEVRVPADAYETVDTGIRDTGEYELTVEREGGGQSSYTVPVGEYALRNGSNLIVTLHENEMELLIEE